MARTGFEQLKKETYFSSMDYWLLVPVLCISLVGLFVLNKVLSDGFGDLYPMNFYRQGGAVLIGLLLAMIFCALEVPTLRLIGWIIYGVSVILLFMTMFDRFVIKNDWGAERWLDLPLLGSFQPSELAKIGLAMSSAVVFEAISRKKLKFWQGFLCLAALYVLPVIFILRQPDFSTTIIIFFMFLCMLFVWGLRWRYVITGISGIIVMLPLAWFFYFADYQKNRILTFLYPGHDPDASYNMLQSRLAIASGGITGSNLETPVHVPVKESDFIFVAVSEHMGMIGTSALLLLFFFYIARIFYVASKIHATRPASALIMAGLGAATAFHVIENIGMTVGLLPITGVPLPFVSLGGTAIITNFVGLGIMLSISMERNMDKG